MTEAPPATRRRRRNSFLEAAETMRQLDLPSGLNSIVLYLYVCENEGLTMSELASVSGMVFATAARLTRTLAGCAVENPAPPESALLELRASRSDRRVSHVFLTPLGRRVRDDLEQVIARASPIRLDSSAGATAPATKAGAPAAAAEPNASPPA
jgi:DNA-binding MarR family transcriptional regulator